MAKLKGYEFKVEQDDEREVDTVQIWRGESIIFQDEVTHANRDLYDKK